MESTIIILVGAVVLLVMVKVILDKRATPVVSEQEWIDESLPKTPNRQYVDLDEVMQEAQGEP